MFYVPKKMGNESILVKRQALVYVCLEAKNAIFCCSVFHQRVEVLNDRNFTLCIRD